MESSQQIMLVKDCTRGNRRARTRAIINSRLSFTRQIDRSYYKHLLSKPHMLAKRKPFDCGKSRCWLCHCDKLSGQRPMKDTIWKDEKIS